MFKQLHRFGSVGLLAAAVHYLMALVLIRYAIPPLAANLVAFLGAVQISYFGHRHYTFEASDLNHASTLPRFLLIALGGFAMNETLLWLALRYTHLPVKISLIGIIALVAFCSFWASRRFVFVRC